MRTLLLLAPLLAFGCNGKDDTAAPRSQCDEGCRSVVLLPCRDACDRDCGTDDLCRDTCHGDCLDRYDGCLAEECGE
jgi:hypothetical protein